VRSQRTYTFADLLAHGISIAFIVMGLFALVAGDMGVDRNRVIRMPVDIVGSDRIMFGLALLATGYVFQRWLLRTPSKPLRWRIEAQVFVIFVAAGYVAYRIGTAS
jgi:hypothetical protein